MIRLVAAAFSLVLLAAAASAEKPRFTVLSTDPETGGALHFGETFYVRYRVESSSPVVVRVEGWSGGKALPLANSGLSELPAGGGEDGAFLFSNTHKTPVSMDELRLIATDATGRPSLAFQSFPLALSWDMGRPLVERPRPAWVAEWSEGRQRKMREKMQAYEARTGPAGGLFSGILMMGVGLIFALVVLACAFAPFAAMYYWRGVWRLLAVLPAIALTVVVVRVVHDTNIDPTSHNLWPFELLMTGGPGLLFLGALALARRFRGSSN